MEIGKIEKFDLSQIKATSKNNPLSIKFESLMPGEAFAVHGAERTSLAYHQTRLKKDGRIFAILKASSELGHFNIIRVK